MSTITHPSFRLNFNLLNSLYLSVEISRLTPFQFILVVCFNILAILVTVKLALGNIKYELKNIIDLMGIVLFIRTTSFNDIKMKIALYIDIKYSEKKISEPRKKNRSACFCCERPSDQLYAVQNVIFQDKDDPVGKK